MVMFAGKVAISSEQQLQVQLLILETILVRLGDLVQCKVLENKPVHGQPLVAPTESYQLVLLGRGGFAPPLLSPSDHLQLSRL